MSSYGRDFVFTLFTNDAALAAAADAAGVDRIGVDLDWFDKAQRQRLAPGSRLNRHRPADLNGIRDAVTQSQVFARTNPIHPGSRQEIEELIDLGVEVLMLPMFRSAAEVEDFVRLVDARATTVPLLEHIDAASALADILRVDGIDEIHVGLNDLSLSLGNRVAGRWELLTSDLLESISEQVRTTGLPFRLGGLGRARQNDIPLPSDLVYAQWPRLGASGALLAQVFFAPDWRTLDLTAEVSKARRRLDDFASAKPDEQDQAKCAFHWWVSQVASP